MRYLHRKATKYEHKDVPIERERERDKEDKTITVIRLYNITVYKILERQAQRRAAMDRRMYCIIPNESYNINHNITIVLTEMIGRSDRTAHTC